MLQKILSLLKRYFYQQLYQGGEKLCEHCLGFLLLMRQNYVKLSDQVTLCHCLGHELDDGPDDEEGIVCL